MSKNENLTVPTEIDGRARAQKYRHSLQPKSTTIVEASSPFRHTQSQNYGNEKRRVKTKGPPPIPEVEVVDEEEAASKTVRKTSKERKVTRKASQNSSRTANSTSFDNQGYESDGKTARSRSNSVANSIRSSNRDPSVQSLSVVREQYCCCSRWSPCERTLFAAVCVLAFIIMILVIVVALLAHNCNKCDCTDGECPTKSTTDLGFLSFLNNL